MRARVRASLFPPFGNTNADWFSASASGTTPSLSGVAASGTYTVEGSKFKVDNDSDSALVFTPDASTTATNMSDGVVTIVAAAELTPSSASDLSAVTGAKVGLAVGVDSDITNYYAYAAAGWKTLSAAGVTVPDSGDTSFKIILDYRTRTAQFYIGSTLMTYGDTTPTTAPAFAAGTDSVVDIQAYGSGSITSIDADYEVAVAAYAGTKYGSIAEAVDAAKAASHTGADVQAIGADGAPAETSAIAANGMNLVVCEALGLGLIFTKFHDLRCQIERIIHRNNHVPVVLLTEQRYDSARICRDDRHAQILGLTDGVGAIVRIRRVDIHV